MTNHPDVAQVAAIVGGLGVALVLVPSRRVPILPGYIATAMGVTSWFPATICGALVDSPGPAGHRVSSRARAGRPGRPVRYPAIVPVAALVAVPFRVPVEIGSQEAFLLLPLYAVLAGATLAFAYVVLSGARLVQIPRVLALPATAFIGLSALSVLGPAM